MIVVWRSTIVFKIIGGLQPPVSYVSPVSPFQPPPPPFPTGLVATFLIKSHFWLALTGDDTARTYVPIVIEHDWIEKRNTHLWPQPSCRGSFNNSLHFGQVTAVASSSTYSNVLKYLKVSLSNFFILAIMQLIHPSLKTSAFGSRTFLVYLKNLIRISIHHSKLLLSGLGLFSCI